MSGDVAPTTISADDAFELGEMLEFICDLIDSHPDMIGESLTHFTGGNYSLAELRTDVARFAFLLGGDGQRFVHGGAR